MSSEEKALRWRKVTPVTDSKLSAVKNRVRALTGSRTIMQSLYEDTGTICGPHAMLNLAKAIYSSRHGKKWETPTT